MSEYKATPSELLANMIGARKILSDPAAWCKTVYARDKHGFGVLVDNPDACRFCVLGASAKASGETEVEFEESYSEQLASYLGEGTWKWVGSWNDAPERTHAEVLDFLDTTISVLKAQVSA